MKVVGREPWSRGRGSSLKAVGSNPSTLYWMDIFTLICYKNCIDVSKDWTETKKGRDGSFLKTMKVALFPDLSWHYYSILGEACRSCWGPEGHGVGREEGARFRGGRKGEDGKDLDGDEQQQQQQQQQQQRQRH